MKTLIMICTLCSITHLPVWNKTTENKAVNSETKTSTLPLQEEVTNQIPSKTYTWDQMTAGDCVLAGGTVTIWADGNIKFSGIVWTNHTHSGDQWHHTITFQDYRGIALFSVHFDGPSHMNDDGSRYNFGPYWQKFDPAFFDAIAQATASGSC